MTAESVRDGSGTGLGLAAEVAAWEKALRNRVHAEVRCDAGSRGAFSTDGSDCRQVPIGVVVPRDVDAGAEAVAVCARFGAPVLSRGRGGGASLAGQCTNDAVCTADDEVPRLLEHRDQELREALDGRMAQLRRQEGSHLDSLDRFPEGESWLVVQLSGENREDVDAQAHGLPRAIPDVPYADFARSTGLDGARVERAGEVEAGWRRALSADRPFVIDFRTDPDVPPMPPHTTRRQAEAVISVVDTALWDPKARLLGLPLVHLLGATRHEVLIYGSGGFTTYNDDQPGRQLRGWVHGQGVPRGKINVGESWCGAETRDRERVVWARQSVGDAAELNVDTNGAYTRKQATRLAPSLTADQVTWREEPVFSDDLTGLAHIGAAVGADVTANEYGRTLPSFRQLLAVDVVDCPRMRPDAEASPYGCGAPHSRKPPDCTSSPLRPKAPRTGRSRHTQPSPSGVVPGPRTDRATPLRRRTGPRRRNGPARNVRPRRSGTLSPDRNRRTPPRLIPGLTGREPV